MDSWLIPGLSVVGGFASAYAGIKVGLAELRERVRTLEREVGDGDSGLRKRYHDVHGKGMLVDGLVKELQSLETRVTSLEKRRQR